MSTDRIVKEYLRRNLVHCSAVGCRANVGVALERLRTWKNPPKWLVSLLEGALERASEAADELATHRDRLKPYLDDLYRRPL